jgi:2'-5' RNA ligase
MRLFTGIAIPQAVIDRLDATLATLRPLAAVRWSPLTNLHITTKFIGSWAEERLDELKRALSHVPTPELLEISISGFGFYPGARQPKIFFANVKAPELEGLNRALEAALEALGCRREDRPFSPHLTLARIGDEKVQALRDALKPVDFGTFTAAEFHLYRSTPGAKGSLYTILDSFALTGALAC